MRTLAVAALLAAASAHAAPKLGEPAPDFTLSDQSGSERSLSDDKGKFVVLEWFNRDCPFVRKHYRSKNMQRLQAKYAKRGVSAAPTATGKKGRSPKKEVVWYSVISSKPGKQGYLTPEQAQEELAGMDSTAILLDPKGDVGRLYGARTTPHMYVIDPQGKLIYMGGIDDRPSTDPDDIPGARNHVMAALDEAMGGKPVSVPNSTPYGCSVKY